MTPHTPSLVREGAEIRPGVAPGALGEALAGLVRRVLVQVRVTAPTWVTRIDRNAVVDRWVPPTAHVGATRRAIVGAVHVVGAPEEVVYERNEARVGAGVTRASVRVCARAVGGAASEQKCGSETGGGFD